MLHTHNDIILSLSSICFNIDRLRWISVHIFTSIDSNPFRVNSYVFFFSVSLCFCVQIVHCVRYSVTEEEKKKERNLLEKKSICRLNRESNIAGFIIWSRYFTGIKNRFLIILWYHNNNNDNSIYFIWPIEKCILRYVFFETFNGNFGGIWISYTDFQSDLASIHSILYANRNRSHSVYPIYFYVLII